MANISATPDAGSGPPSNRLIAPEPAPVVRDAPPSASQADLRLVIEEDQASGSYIYKTVDRRTGEVVSQFPRDEILQMRGKNEYSAGDVVRARI